MSSKLGRQEMIQAIASAEYDLNRVNFKDLQLKDVFGINVFNEATQRELLPKPVYKALQRTIKQGEPLDPSVADAVASAMKDWPSRRARRTTHTSSSP